jgi:hypothetical protein
MRSIIRKNKSAAIEMAIGTIVVIVIAMSMLILGLVLVKTIFTGAKYNVDQLNKNVEGEINKLFNEKGGKTYIYLPNNQVDIKKGSSYGVAFGIKNNAQGEVAASTFNYNIQATSVQEGCQLTVTQATAYAILGRSGNLQLSPGIDPAYRLVKIQPPSSAPLCEIQYDLTITKNGQPYDSTFFIVKITG